MNGVCLNRIELGSQLVLNHGRTAKQVGMQQPQHLENEFVQIHPPPASFALAYEAVDSVNNVAGTPGVREDIIQQFLEHFHIGQAARQKPLSGRGIAGNGGEGLIQFVCE